MIDGQAHGNEFDYQGEDYNSIHDDCDPGPDHLPFSNDESVLAKSMLSSGEERISNALKDTKYNPTTNQFEPVVEVSQENESSLSMMKFDTSKNSSNKDDSYPTNPTSA